MQVKLGDFVRFVDENIEGYVTRIIDKDMIGVTDANDFEIPVQASKVTLVYGEMSNDSEVVKNKTQVAVPEAEFIKEGVYLGLVSDQHSNVIAHFHLVNDTSYQFLLAFSSEKGDHFRGEFAGFIPPHAAVKIFSANMGDIQLWPKFRLEALYYTPANVEPKAPLLFHQQIKGKDLSVAKTEIALLKQKGWLIRLDTPPAVLDAQKLKESFFK
ncbi:hypothetical protein [Pedobacter immunditicola]|uniref:hypothetical protein n=1 Tax=Pedobacter immunditicola TaxID=3133440 RepID=UPI00309A2659